MKQRYQGLGVAAALAALALGIGKSLPLLGVSLTAILLGIILGNTYGVRPAWEKGLAFSAKKGLQLAIILLGFTFTIGQVSAVGLASLKVSLITICLALLVAYLVGKKLKLGDKLSLLIGFGTAICGGSAIAAAAPVLEADEEDLALSLSTIFFFNILAVFVFPLLGHVMGMTDQAFGLWAGTAINDTSSVVAAGYAYSPAAGDYATIVKLARALMIIPACLIMALVKLYQQGKRGKSVKLRQIFPWFILFFVLASVLASTGVLRGALPKLAKPLSQFIMAMALVGIGSRVSLASFKAAGLAPLILGLVTWLAISGASLLLQFISI